MTGWKPVLPESQIAMTQQTVSVVKEPDETAAPLVFAYLGGVLVWLFAVLAWVFYFRGYA